MLGFGAVHAIDLPEVDDRDINVQINEYFEKLSRLRPVPFSNEIAKGLNVFVESGKITLQELDKICSFERRSSDPLFQKNSPLSTYVGAAYFDVKDIQTLYPRVNAVLEKALNGAEVSADDLEVVQGLGMTMIKQHKTQTTWYYSFGPKKDKEYSSYDGDFFMMKEANQIHSKSVNTPAYQQTLDAEAFVQARQRREILHVALEKRYIESIKQMATRIPHMSRLVPLVEYRLVEIQAREAEVQRERDRAAKKAEAKEIAEKAAAERELARIAAKEAEAARARVAEEKAKKEIAEKAAAERELARIAAEEAEATRTREAEEKAKKELVEKAAAERELARIAAEEAEAAKEKARVDDEAARAREAAEQERLEKEEAARKLADKPLPVVPTPAEPKPVITPKLPAPGTDATPEKLVKRGKTALAATGIFGFGVGLGGVFLVKKVARLVSLNRLIKAAESSESVTFGKLRSLKNERSELVGELKLLAPATTLMAIAAVYAHRKSYEA
ncbi:MAG: hypothetical protein QG604_279, partial [Candidatus Dependentiae bacterium]|nr:hypothetical protein [Candidatus Dependentiae bacterium]